MNEENPWANKEVITPEPIKRSITWLNLFLRVLGAFFIFSIISHIFIPAPIPSGNWSTLEKLIIEIFTYSIDYFLIFILSTILFLIFGKIIPKYRTIPITSLFHNALIASLIVCAIYIYMAVIMLLPIYNGHMKAPVRIEQVILYSIGLGILGFIVGGIFDSRLILMIGAIAFLPLCVILFLAALGAAWEAADGIIPNFKGKRFLVILVVLLVAVAFIFTIFIGVGTENLGCPSYRGELTC